MHGDEIRLQYELNIGSLCVYIVDAWRSNAVETDDKCVPNLGLVMCGKSTITLQFLYWAKRHFWYHPNTFHPPRKESAELKWWMIIENENGNSNPIWTVYLKAAERGEKLLLLFMVFFLTYLLSCQFFWVVIGSPTFLQKIAYSKLLCCMLI